MLVIKEWVWKVEVFLTEGDGLTRAEAVLHAGPHRDLRGIGHARLDPDDYDFPEIGDEIAASRALADLAHRIRTAAAVDIRDVTGENARVHP
jgi:hypothetical protein